MAFLRKKNSQDARSNVQVTRQPESADPGSSRFSPSPPPLFAKFATGGNWKSDANASMQSRLVSAPMPLSSTPRRKPDPEPLAYHSRRPDGTAITQAGREEREFDARGNQAQMKKKFDPYAISKPLPNYDPMLARNQPPMRSNIDHQLLPDAPLPPTPSNHLRTPSVDKPLPFLNSASPAPPFPTTSYPVNGRRSGENPPAIHPSNGGVFTSSIHQDKPLPKPSTTPPPAPRSLKGKEREAGYFTQHDPKQRQNEGSEIPYTPPAPANQGSGYSAIPTRIPNYGKTLPSQPGLSSTPSSIQAAISTGSIPIRHAPPIFNQSYSPSIHRKPSRTSPRSDQPAARTPPPPPSSSKPLPGPTDTTVVYKSPPAVPGPPPFRHQDVKPALGNPMFPDQTVVSNPNDTFTPYPTQGYDDTASRTPMNQLSDSATKRHPGAPAPSDQSTWLTLHADAFKASERPIVHNDSNLPFNDPPGQSLVGASTSTVSSTHSSGTKSNKSRSNSGSKSRRPISPLDSEERTDNLNAKAMEVLNQPQVQRKPSNPNQFQRTAPVRGKPLIFAAMATVDQPNEDTSFMPPYQPPVDDAPAPYPTEQSNLYDADSGHVGPIPPWPVYHPSQSPPPTTRAHSRSPAEVSHEAQPKHQLHHQPSKPRKLSKSGTTAASPPPETTSSPPPLAPAYSGRPPSDLHTRPSHRTLTKPRPPDQTLPETTMHDMGPPVEDDRSVAPKGLALLDDDPFARTTGVKMLQPVSEPSLIGPNPRSKPPSRDGNGNALAMGGGYIDDHVSMAMPPETSMGHIRDGAMAEKVSHKSPPEDYRKARSRRRGEKLEKAPPPVVADVTVRDYEDERPFPLVYFLSEASLLRCFLNYLTFYEWCVLSSVSKYIRIMLQENVDLREEVLERYMATVGYGRWIWSEPEPLTLSLRDLNDYMRGVSTPTHEYARTAELYLQAVSCGPLDQPADSSVFENVESLTAATRAYTRVVLRLRAQAESDHNARTPDNPLSRGPSLSHSNEHAGPPQTWNNPSTQGTLRTPSPPMSLYSHSVHGHTLSRNQSNSNFTVSSGRGNTSTAAIVSPDVVSPATMSGKIFRSPLFRLRRAPLLRVFVPSPGGDWLSDASVLQCEAELKSAGVTGMLRMGDVVWDVAVGDEGNVGRLMWDGSYLIDLDYSYSRVGDMPKYLPALAFPPSYFHRVIRTGPSSSNPVVHVDISPWGEEIATNLQLLQDRVRTETPQGTYHNVVRWVHRSSFVMQPPSSGRAAIQHHIRAQPSSPPRIPIPGEDKMTVDTGWYGTVVVEAEGTNEGLADLQDRCGPGVFPPRAGGVPLSAKTMGAKKVFRILREKSRPGEIWIRSVREKEKLM